MQQYVVTQKVWGLLYSVNPTITKIAVGFFEYMSN